jgi:hypothetical protein
MENFNLKKYLAEGRLLKEIDGDFGVNLNTPENAVKFKDSYPKWVYQLKLMEFL